MARFGREQASGDRADLRRHAARFNNAFEYDKRSGSLAHGCATRDCDLCARSNTWAHACDRFIHACRQSGCLQPNAQYRNRHRAGECGARGGNRSRSERRGESSGRYSGATSPCGETTRARSQTIVARQAGCFFAGERRVQPDGRRAPGQADRSRHSAAEG